MRLDLDSGDLRLDLESSDLLRLLFVGLGKWTHTILLITIKIKMHV